MAKGIQIWTFHSTTDDKAFSCECKIKDGSSKVLWSFCHHVTELLSEWNHKKGGEGVLRALSVPCASPLCDEAGHFSANNFVSEKIQNEKAMMEMSLL